VLVLEMTSWAAGLVEREREGTGHASATICAAESVHPVLLPLHSRTMRVPRLLPPPPIARSLGVASSPLVLQPPLARARDTPAPSPRGKKEAREGGGTIDMRQDGRQARVNRCCWLCRAEKEERARSSCVNYAGDSDEASI
jgi:hypothetical protein